MMLRVEYLPLGVKNMQTKIMYFSLRDLADYGKIQCAAKTLGCLVSDIQTVEQF